MFVKNSIDTLTRFCSIFGENYKMASFVDSLGQYAVFDTYPEMVAFSIFDALVEILRKMSALWEFY